MNDKRQSLHRLFRAVDEVGEDLPANHEEYLALIPSLVEAEMAGADIRNLYADLLTHLDSCSECDAEYVALLDLALADASGTLPEAGTYPPLRLPPAVALRQLVRKIAAAIVRVPEQLEDLPMILQTFFEQVDVAKSRLTFDPSSALVMGLNEGSPEPLPRVMAIYYALESLLKRYSAAELRVLEPEKLKEALGQIAREEAQRYYLKGQTANTFVEAFVHEVLAAMPAVLDISSE